MARVKAETVKPPFWYRIVAGLALIWSLARCMGYYGQVAHDADDLALLAPAKRAILEMMPSWIIAVDAIDVGAAALAAILLAMRMKGPRPLFIASLAAMLVHFGWTFLATPTLAVVGPVAVLKPAAILAVGIFLVWFAGYAKQRNWRH